MTNSAVLPVSHTARWMDVATTTLIMTTVIMNILFVDAGDALQLSRTRSMQRAMGCGSREESPALDITTHPTGIVVGSHPVYGKHSGAIVGNNALVSGSIALHGLVVVVCAAVTGLSLKDAASKLGFPSRTLTVGMFLFQPIVTSALFVGVYGDATSRLIGAAALLLVFLSMAAVANITVLSAFTAEWVREHVLDPNESAGMMR